jgi:hypothetical protein
MKISRFNNPLDTWTNEGGALARETASAASQPHPMGFGGPSKWICRFLPRSYRRSHAKQPSPLHRLNPCVLRYG